MMHSLTLYGLITRDMMGNVTEMRLELDRTEALLKQHGPMHAHAGKWTHRALSLPGRIEAYEAAIRQRGIERNG